MKIAAVLLVLLVSTAAASADAAHDFERLSARCAEVDPRGRNTVPAACLAADALLQDIRAFSSAYTHCGGYDGTDDLELMKSCAVADGLQKKLTAQGFCIYGHGAVGRAGRPWTQQEWKQTGGLDTVWPKGRKHCYAMHYPDPPLH